MSHATQLNKQLSSRSYFSDSYDVQKSMNDKVNICYSQINEKMHGMSKHSLSEIVNHLNIIELAYLLASIKNDNELLGLCREVVSKAIDRNSLNIKAAALKLSDVSASDIDAISQFIILLCKMHIESPLSSYNDALEECKKFLLTYVKILSADDDYSLYESLTLSIKSSLISALIYVGFALKQQDLIQAALEVNKTLGNERLHMDLSPNDCNRLVRASIYSYFATCKRTYVADAKLYFQRAIEEIQMGEDMWLSSSMAENAIFMYAITSEMHFLSTWNRLYTSNTGNILEVTRDSDAIFLRSRLLRENMFTCFLDVFNNSGLFGMKPYIYPINDTNEFKMKCCTPLTCFPLFNTMNEMMKFVDAYTG